MVEGSVSAASTPIVAAVPPPMGAGGGVKSAERALQIIELLTRYHDGLTFVQILEHLEVPKSSLHSLLRTMVQRGHLWLEPNTRTYRLGVRLWEAGQAFVRGVDLVRLAQPHLRAASEDLNETVQLAVLDGLENVYIAKEEAEQRLKLVSEVGGRLPAHTTALGKVLLAGLPEHELLQRLADHELQRFTDSTITDRDDLLTELGRTRERGYGIDEGEYTPGVVCWAVPIRDHEQQVVAAISVSIPDVRVTQTARGEIIEILQQHADRLSASIGGGSLPSGRSFHGDG